MSDLSHYFFFQAEDGIRDFCLSRGLGDVYKRQGEESALIGEAGGALFGRSEEENHRRLTLILEQLDDRIKTVRGELGEKQKIYATVSMVLGGMLVILLI